MRRFTLRQLVFMALCCDLGLFSKRLIGPVANIFTDALHVPGGVGTAFSIMFVVVATSVCDVFGAATVMCIIQSAIALALGMVGSMGMLSPIGYIVPGIMIDLLFFAGRKLKIPHDLGIPIINGVAAMTASLTANVIVFRLRGPVLLLYLAISLTCGVIFGSLGAVIIKRLVKVLHLDRKRQSNKKKIFEGEKVS